MTIWRPAIPLIPAGGFVLEVPEVYFSGLVRLLPGDVDRHVGNPLADKLKAARQGRFPNRPCHETPLAA